MSICRPNSSSSSSLLLLLPKGRGERGEGSGEVYNASFVTCRQSSILPAYFLSDSSCHLSLLFAFPPQKTEEGHNRGDILDDILCVLQQDEEFRGNGDNPTDFDAI